MAVTASNAARKSRRFGIVFALLSILILVEVLTVFSVLASQRFATERALREHSHELLKNVIDETRENASGYLRRAQDSVALASNVFEAGLLAMDNPDRLERYFVEQLRVVPQIDGLYFADQLGNFVFSKRSGEENDGFLTKIIRSDAPQPQRVAVITRDKHLVETSRAFDPDDRFDPRERPWYTRAVNEAGEIWTQPYIFFTSKRPGVTVASSIWKPGDATIGVVGADIELSALSDFLKTQRIGLSGAAFIIDRDGNVIAHPSDNRLTPFKEGDALRLKQLDQMDAVTAQASAHLARTFPDLTDLKDTHYDKFELNDRFYLSMFVPLLGQGDQRWLMGVYAPEDELALKIREGQRESIFLGVVVSLLVVTAAFLIGLTMLRPIDRLQREAAEDPLTGLLNRRSFDDMAGRRLTQAAKQGLPICALMVDIDHFKPINDQYGHAVGDEVLLAVARRINRGLSDRDLLSRYGGEEFAIVLPDTTLEQGRRIAERLRESVNSAPIKTSAGAMRVTISLGVTERDASGTNLAALLNRADQGMLAAKRDGRDQVMSVEAHLT